MLKFKVGDKVRVISGKDKGREGTIEKILVKQRKAIVSGINIYKKHVKASLSKDGKGGVYEVARPIHLSKLMVVDPETGKPTRVGFRYEADKKVRFSKKTGKLLS